MVAHAREVVVVTGGSSGLGLFVTRALCEQKFTVVNLDQMPHQDPAVFSHTVDLSNLEELEVVLQKVTRNFPRIDALVNLANEYYLSPLSEYVDTERLARATRTNVVAPLICVARLLDSLQRGSYPLVVNVSSNAAQGAPFAAQYVMSKGAMNALTAAINEEFRINGVLRASTIMFGSIEVGLTQRQTFRAITAVPGRDPVIQPQRVAEFVVDLIENRMHQHVREVSVEPHKLNIRKLDLDLE
jgi:NAD(P)-dependent dehydrogenase (short-subunit alcohol dehydrogenase family)